MKKILNTILLLIALQCISGQSEDGSPIKVAAEYVGEYFSNFSGGLKKGQTYLGLLDFGIFFKTEDIGVWKNGEFSVLVENTHGGSPTSDYIGDMQVASNIENGDFTYLYELWYKHEFSRFCFKLGLLDFNADCHVSDRAGMFLNSSFGIMPTVPLNMPVPIFPLPALGISFKYNLSPNTSLVGGIWDGDPGEFETNRYNIEWSLNSQEGFLYSLEAQHKFGNSGSVKFGGVYHSGSFEYLSDADKTERGNTALHLIAENTLINRLKGEKGKIDAFLQLGYAPIKEISINSFYIGSGINVSGLLLSSAEDVLGLGLAYAGISSELTKNDSDVAKAELAIELSYYLPVFNNISIQPDIQYIINPGADKTLNNALVASVRLVVSH